MAAIANRRRHYGRHHCRRRRHHRQQPASAHKRAIQMSRSLGLRALNSFRIRVCVRECVCVCITHSILCTHTRAHLSAPTRAANIVGEMSNSSVYVRFTKCLHLYEIGAIYSVSCYRWGISLIESNVPTTSVALLPHNVLMNIPYLITCLKSNYD